MAIVKFTFENKNIAPKEVKATLGDNISELADDNEIHINHNCGRVCACSTCHAYIDDAWATIVGGPNDIEDATLDLANDRRSGSRLTCQVTVTAAMDGLVVHVAKND